MRGYLALGRRRHGGLFRAALSDSAPALATPSADVLRDLEALADLSRALTPPDVVAKLDDHIVGQAAAKRAVAVALRNRWRRQQLPDDLKKEV